jgi:hypothetical protein
MDEIISPSSLNQPTPIHSPETIVQLADPLTLDLPEETFIQVINTRINESQRWFEANKDLKTRRARNKDYLFGRQLPRLKSHQSKYVDNIIWQAESTIKPIALSRLPDLTVKPGNDTEESKKNAKNVTAVINNDIRKRENRKVLSLAFRHLPVYYVGIIKAYWDPEAGDEGDYKFRAINPDNVVFDHTATSNDPDQMDFLAEAVEISIKECLMRWPKKADELLQYLFSINKMKAGDENDEAKLATKIKIWEVWFDWWEKDKKITGVAWKYENVLLGKMKHPYWDWKGKTVIQGDEMQMRMAMAMGQEIPTQTVYANFLANPSKPYILVGYEQWGEQPLDETSRIEQVIYMQDNVNKRGRQITDMNDTAKGRHVFSTLSGLTKADVEAMDLDNPTTDIVVNGQLGDVHNYIPGTPADPAQFTELSNDREKVFSAMGTNSTTRGEQATNETATGRQILRESDFGRIDDLVEDTINAAAEKMAAWAMQFIKRFYTSEHMKRIIGEGGDVTFNAITQDNIEDGMEVIVSASGVDKLMGKREAYERANLKLTDPLSFFSDINASDPAGRTEKLMLFTLAPELYLQKFVLKRDVNAMVAALGIQPPPVAPNPNQPPPAPNGGQPM